MGEIRAYLEERQAASRRGLPRGLAAKVLRRVAPFGLRQRAKVKGTSLLIPASRVKIRRILRGNQEVRLHLGCGPHRITGWVNIDVLGMHPDLHWDLARGIPFPNDSAEAVFLEHFLEHFPLSIVLEILEECRRVLRPGGTLRAGVPDFGRYLESYAGDREFIGRLRPGRPTPLLAVAEVALAHGHRSVWDAETLEHVFREAGFVEVRAREWGESELEPAPDSKMREPESVYAEGRKRHASNDGAG